MPSCALRARAATRPREETYLGSLTKAACALARPALLRAAPLCAEPFRAANPTVIVTLMGSPARARAARPAHAPIARAAPPSKPALPRASIARAAAAAAEGPTTREKRERERNTPLLGSEIGCPFQSSIISGWHKKIGHSGFSRPIAPWPWDVSSAAHYRRLSALSTITQKPSPSRSLSRCPLPSPRRGESDRDAATTTS